MRHEHACRYEFAAGFVAGRSVVDCASGDATGSLVFAAGGAARVHGFDTSLAAVFASRGAAARVGLGVADAQALPLRAGCAEVFISLETIEHLRDGDAFLDEVRRVLRPGGLFICSTPDRTVYNPGRSLTSRPWNPYHVREYSLEEFADRLAARFDSVEMYGQNPQRAATTRWLTRLARAVPGHATVRLQQVLKLPRFLFGRKEKHRVRRCREPFRYEYLVAVCRYEGRRQ